MLQWPDTHMCQVSATLVALLVPHLPTSVALLQSDLSLVGRELMQSAMLVRSDPRLSIRRMPRAVP